MQKERQDAKNALVEHIKTKKTRRSAKNVVQIHTRMKLEAFTARTVDKIEEQPERIEQHALIAQPDLLAKSAFHAMQENTEI